MQQPPSPSAVQALIVEDDAALREILQLVLEEQGRPVAFAASGQEALEMARRLRPPLLMVDLGLPDMSGLEVARRLRQDFPEMTMIAFTGFDSADHRRQAEAVGFDHFYVKPMDLEAMERTFERIFRLARE